MKLAGPREEPSHQGRAVMGGETLGDAPSDKALDEAAGSSALPAEGALPADTTTNDGMQTLTWN